MRHIHLFLLALVLAIGMTGVATAALPTQVNAKISDTGGTSMPTSASYYWKVEINSQTPPDGDLLPGIYAGWCVDAQHTIAPSTYNFKVYSSLDPAKMEENSYLKTIPDGNWNKMNYVINNKAIAGNNARAIQAAIWHYDGGVMPSGYGTWDDSSDYSAIVAAADSNPGFVPVKPQLYAVVIVPIKTNGDWTGEQISLIEVQAPPTTVTVPEFPAMFLPAGMLIGMIFVVSMLRKKS